MTRAALDGPRLMPAAGAPPRSIVLLLHGYGSNGADMMSFAPLWRSALPDAVFLAPNGPERCPGVPGGFQWWGLTSLNRAGLAAGVARAQPVLDAYIDRALATYGLAEDRLVLVGFSQGTMMALHAGPLRARQVAGIVGYSGLLAHPHLPDGVRTKPPVLLIHGDADPVVPFSGLQQSKSELLRLGFAVESHVSRGLGHSVDDTGLKLGLAFARRALAAPE